MSVRMNPAASNNRRRSTQQNDFPRISAVGFAVVMLAVPKDHRLQHRGPSA